MFAIHLVRIDKKRGTCLSRSPLNGRYGIGSVIVPGLLAFWLWTWPDRVPGRCRHEPAVRAGGNNPSASRSRSLRSG